MLVKRPVSDGTAPINTPATNAESTNAALTNDVDVLRGWVGSTETQHEVIDVEGAGRVALTLGHTAELAVGSLLPPLWHWTWFVSNSSSTAALGPDGHPPRGGFLPPVALPRRMWAGGALDFGDPIHIGDAITKTSTITDVTVKEGSTGTLCFVTVEHVLQSGDAPCITERQDIVYRDDPDPSVPARAPKPAPSEFEWSDEFEPSAPLLFRYSALTFNAHRIHYDRDYATAVEGYPALVVHGPLTATMLANLAVSSESGRLTRYTFRGMAPLLDTATIPLRGSRSDRGGYDLWAETADGGIGMSATAEFA